MAGRYAVLGLVVMACGNPHGGGPEAGADAGVEDAGDDAGGTDAPPSGPIMHVETADGFTQICEQCLEELVITGMELDTVTRVTLGAVEATILSATPGELRVSLLSDTALGPQPLTIQGAFGTATKANAIEVTPKVVSPTAPLTGGRATFQSPINMCDPELAGDCSGDPDGTCRRANERFDTLLLLAGNHVCVDGLPLQAGVIVQGAGTALTTVASTFFFDDPGSQPFRAEVHDLTITSSSSKTISAFGLLLVDHVVSTGGGIVLSHALGTSTIANTTISDCTDGVFIEPLDNEFGSLELSHVEVRHCNAGLRIGNLPTLFGSAPAPVVTANDLQLVDNAIGIVLIEGNVALTTTTISDDETTPPSTTTGIDVTNGYITLHGGSITGQTTGMFVRAFDDHLPSIELDGTTIAGGSVGIDIGAFTDQIGFTLRRTTISGQTSAAVRVDGDEFVCDFGTDTDPGQNALSVVSGFAIDDHRSTLSAERFETAIGTTLNGHSYAGMLLSGPLVIGTDISLVVDRDHWQF